MYDERIENLISAALADGELTEKEKQILFKNAEAQGIDLDEFEMVLDAKLVTLKKQEAALSKQQELELAKAKAAAQASPAAPKSDKYGDVRKCPACGAIVPSLKAKCPECGHNFSSIAGNSSIERLMNMLLEVEANDNESAFSKFISTFFNPTSNKVARQKANIISNFPVPNTKEDILEFISQAESKAESTGFRAATTEDLVLNKVWKDKLKQVLIKGRIVLKDDPEAMETIERCCKKFKVK